MSQVAVRLDADELAAVDELVADGRYPSRAAAIRAALAAQRRDEAERVIAAAYAQGYCRLPAVGSEALSVAAIAAFYGDEPPWDDPAAPSTP